MLGLKRSFEMQSSSSITMDDEQPFTPQRIRTHDKQSCRNDPVGRNMSDHDNVTESSSCMDMHMNMDIDVPPSPCPTSTASSPATASQTDQDASYYTANEYTEQDVTKGDDPSSVCEEFFTRNGKLTISYPPDSAMTPSGHSDSGQTAGSSSRASSFIPPSPSRSTLDPEYAERLFHDGDVRLLPPPGIQRGKGRTWNRIESCSNTYTYRTPVNSFSSGEGPNGQHRSTMNSDTFATPERSVSLPRNTNTDSYTPSPSRSTLANEYYTPQSSPLSLNRSLNRTKDWQCPTSVRQSSITSKSPKVGTTYSDRFIPSRSTSNLSFSVWNDSCNDRNANHGNGNSPRQDRQQVEEDGNEATRQDGSQSGSSAQLMNALLRSELLGENIDPRSRIGSTNQNMSMTPTTGTRGDGSSTSSYMNSANGANPNRSPLREGGNFLRYHQNPRQIALSNVYGSSNCDSSSLLDSFSVSPIKNPNHHLLLTLPQKRKRRISKVPFKVLDAPALADDFYLNLVDWSSLNVLAVGLGSCVYLWSACTSKVTKLCDLGGQPQDAVTSVAWTQRGTYLAVGVNRGEVQIWDVAKCQKLRSMGGHEARIGALAWSGATLASGSRDRTICLRDVRVPDSYTDRLTAHKQEVCGLKWSFDEPSHLASGGNDNKLLVWDVKKHRKPSHRFAEHTAAVKAIAWSPHQHGLLASGGGTADRCIRFWNALSGTPLNAIDTGSQVCNLAWSQNCNEIVSTHGYSLNQIALWKYPSMQKVATLTGHTYRVLYLAMSPDGSTIVT